MLSATGSSPPENREARIEDGGPAEDGCDREA